MIGLELSAELGGVTNLRFRDSDSEYFPFKFKVQCESCRAENPRPIDFNAHERQEAEHTRGEFSFVMRCKECKRHGSINVVHPPPPVAYNAEDSGSAKTMAVFDCRHFVLLEFVPDGLFHCESATHPTQFREVELLEGEWYDYDEAAGAEVSIQNVQWTLKKLK